MPWRIAAVLSGLILMGGVGLVGWFLRDSNVEQTYSPAYATSNSCELLLRYSRPSGFLSDYNFEVGLRCPAGSGAFERILETGEGKVLDWGIALPERTAGHGAEIPVVMATCWEDRGLENRLRDLNRRGSTGFSFTLQFIAPPCAGGMAALPGRVTELGGR